MPSCAPATTAFLSQPRPHVALASYPRSGNSLTRALLENLTATYTGSDFCRTDAVKGDSVNGWSKGETMHDERVWIVKTCVAAARSLCGDRSATRPTAMFAADLVAGIRVSPRAPEHSLPSLRQRPSSSYAIRSMWRRPSGPLSCPTKIRRGLCPPPRLRSFRWSGTPSSPRLHGHGKPSISSGLRALSGSPSLSSGTST